MCRVNLYIIYCFFNKFEHTFSLMAKLEKADQAFCFTSGMAALAAVTHLLQSGK
jgi:cystathionine beta-lyase/cystathionine gamma-synthase